MNSNITRKLGSIITIFALIVGQMMPSQVYAQGVANLPAPGTMVTTSPSFIPPVLKGLIINPEQPFQFDFVFDSGDSVLTEEEIEGESTRLIKYFLASLTMPEDELWVNLSPYEKDRIISDNFGKTEMGRDLLAQDYLLKQLTASLIYPEEGLGKEFWDKVYDKANELYGTSEVPINTFNKVWIIPDKALIYENGDRVFTVETHMKVMLEEDYFALEQNSLAGTDIEKLSEVSSSIIREVIIPEIEKEVNHGKNFAKLRQIYHSFILAAWYKKNLYQSVLSQKYADQKKVVGLETADKNIKDKIYQQYLNAFEKGVYNFIKEDYDETTQEIIPRKYFSGGVKVSSSSIETQNVQLPEFGKNRYRISANFHDPTNSIGGASSPIDETAIREENKPVEAEPGSSGDEQKVFEAGELEGFKSIVKDVDAIVEKIDKLPPEVKRKRRRESQEEIADLLRPLTRGGKYLFPKKLSDTLSKKRGLMGRLAFFLELALITDINKRPIFNPSQLSKIVKSYALGEEKEK